MNDDTQEALVLDVCWINFGVTMALRPREVSGRPLWGEKLARKDWALLRRQASIGLEVIASQPSWAAHAFFMRGRKLVSEKCKEIGRDRRAPHFLGE